MLPIFVSGSSAIEEGSFQVNLKQRHEKVHGADSTTLCRPSSDVQSGKSLLQRRSETSPVPAIGEGYVTRSRSLLAKPSILGYNLSSSGIVRSATLEFHGTLQIQMVHVFVFS